MEGSSFELVLGVADHGPPVAEDQQTVAALAHIGVPFAVKPTRPGIFLHPADELIASHEDIVSDIFVRKSKSPIFWPTGEV